MPTVNIDITKHEKIFIDPFKDPFQKGGNEIDDPRQSNTTTNKEVIKNNERKDRNEKNTRTEEKRDEAKEGDE